jgi:hypothetical protein
LIGFGPKQAITTQSEMNSLIEIRSFLGIKGTYAITQRTSSKEDQVLCYVPECLEVRIQVVPG